VRSRADCVSAPAACPSAGSLVPPCAAPSAAQMPIASRIAADSGSRRSRAISAASVSPPTHSWTM